MRRVHEKHFKLTAKTVLCSGRNNHEVTCMNGLFLVLYGKESFAVKDVVVKFTFIFDKRHR